MKHEVEMMQNEMVVFCFLTYNMQICHEKKRKKERKENNEKPQLG
jgi:hypothetical protein